MAGLGIGLTLAISTQATPFHWALILLGAQAGASAPDWLEVPIWVHRTHWFRRDESHRYSIIPHRTITHTLAIWLALFGLAAHQFGGAPSPHLSRIALGFCASVLSHLLLDIRTPMGIPLLPFGRRYRLQGLRLVPAHTIQPRSGW